ncbi:MAG: GGDEF domain-containing protein [Deltaproteobacteria bacterium]|nr:GGDEF domain-containing protein [Deltaproteobacteria bacterium]HCH65648.1 GGDEF domain-containing protein [Deltaproteobacteria bacterium]
MAFGDDLTDKTVSDLSLPSMHGLQEELPGLLFLSGSKAGHCARMSPGRWIIGRSLDAQIPFPHESVSRQHCEVTVRPDGVVSIRDLGSLNGTQINGLPVGRDASVALQEGDQVRLSASAHLKFVRQTSREAELQEGLYKAAVHDPLTGLLNRRAMDARLEQDFAYVRRHNTDLVLAVIDLDHFKRVNDTWGHDAGDLVLKACAHRIREQVRQEDLVARFGGEEFVLAMRGARAHDAMALTERIRQRVAIAPIRVPEGSVPVTLSAGVAHATEHGIESAADLFALADRRLYLAKNQGRNRVIGPTGI